MAAISKEKLLNCIQEVIDEGHATSRTAFPLPGGELAVDPQAFGRLTGRCRHLAHLLGERATVWHSDLTKDSVNYLAQAQRLLGVVESIKAVVERDLLIRIERLLDAETFADLLEQAEHLAQQQYHQAAGVLGRAVLEEHLRKWCDAKGCRPSAPRPTIKDYNDALHKALPAEYDKITMQHVTALAAIGNDAAHGKQVKPEDIERLLREVRDFLRLHPIS